jgi:hypothetical protein
MYQSAQRSYEVCQICAGEHTNALLICAAEGACLHQSTNTHGIQRCGAKLLEMYQRTQRTCKVCLMQLEGCQVLEHATLLSRLSPVGMILMPTLRP